MAYINGRETVAISVVSKDFPLGYDEARDGDKLYTVDFSASYFRHIDDSEKYFDDGGTTYDGDAEVNTDKRTEWEKNISENAVVENAKELRIEANDTTGATDHRYIGYFPAYDLENKTYTYVFEFFRNYDKRSKFFFANGNFVNSEGGNVTSGGCDPTMPCLGFELNYASGKIDYKLYRQGIGFVNDENLFNRKTVAFAKDASGEFVANMKVVLSGGARQTVTLYEGKGTLGSGVPKWVGDIIPISYTIYHSTNDAEFAVASGLIYQPATIGLVFGIGNYEALANGEYYGARNLSIYKGDVVQAVDLETFVSNPSAVVSVNLPNATKILGNAFSGKSNLKNIFMPKVSEIGDSTFFNCFDLALTSLPNGVTKIGSGAFRGCEELALTSLPSDLTAIKESTFYDCIKLALTSLPESVTAIGKSAFYGCTKLALTSLPNGLKEISESAFRNCSNLALTSLPSGITGIGSNAFNGCSKLALTSLPSGVKLMTSGVFGGCSNLALKSLPSGVTVINGGAFQNCSKLALTEIPSGVLSIDINAFYNCTSLTELTFKGTPTSIATNAFSGCTNLKIINVPWSRGAVANAPWGATNATINYDYVPMTFYIEYIDTDGALRTKEYAINKDVTWSELIESHEDFSLGSQETILWRNGETLKLNGEEVLLSNPVVDGAIYSAM